MSIIITSTTLVIIAFIASGIKDRLYSEFTKFPSTEELAKQLSNPIPPPYSTFIKKEREKLCPSRLDYVSDCDDELPVRRIDLRVNRLGCFPPEGGIWILDASPLLLNQLRITRFTHTEKSANDTEEILFCEKLRQLGAAHFPPWGPCTFPMFDSELPDWCTPGDPEERRPKDRPDICVAPDWNPGLYIAEESGVRWALKKSGQPWEHHRALGNALTMHEHLTILKVLGARQCKGIEDCIRVCNK